MGQASTRVLAFEMLQGVSQVCVPVKVLPIILTFALVESLKELVQTKTIDEVVNALPGNYHLGTKTTIASSSNAAEDIAAFVEQVSTFICSGGAHGNQLWPLVKGASIQVNSSILSGGLVLVDLPGGGDANAARDSIARDYLMRCDAVWIVADITRALDNAISTKYIQLYAEGCIADGCLTLIATKSEQRASEEKPWEKSCSEMLKLKAAKNQLTAQITKAHGQLGNLPKPRPYGNLKNGGSPHKMRHMLMSRPAILSGTTSGSPTSPPAIMKMREERSRIEKAIDVLRIVNRNISVIDRWEAKAKDAVAEIMGSETVLRVKAFAVSVQEFRGFCESMMPTQLRFADISEAFMWQTGIEALGYHAIEQTIFLQELAITRYVNRVRSLITSLVSYFKFAPLGDNQMDLHLQLIDEVEMLKHCVDNADELHNNLLASIPWQTYLAVLRHNGEWRQSNLNEMLVRPLVRRLAVSWNANLQTNLRRHVMALSDIRAGYEQAYYCGDDKRRSSNG
ncbi:hypothetical protein K439DRAFT_1616220 [Ramaria rubella]|nr:hypothetical protein K439DRAFT_1616220 [Ramaria rubella]